MRANSKPRTRNDPEIRRVQILDEAIRLISHKGFRGFTLQQLASQCGLTNGGVLYHFPSKEDVLTGALELLEQRMTQDIESRFASDDALPSGVGLKRETVLKVLRIMLEQSASDSEVTRFLAVLQIEAFDPGHPAHAYMRAHSRSVFSRFAQIFHLVTPEPVSVARQAIALMNGLHLLWLDDASFDLLEEWDKAIAKILPDTVGEAL